MHLWNSMELPFLKSPLLEVFCIKIAGCVSTMKHVLHYFIRYISEVSKSDRKLMFEWLIVLSLQFVIFV